MTVKLYITLCWLLLSVKIFAQTAISNPDSVAYQQQREKINNMLVQRSAKFGRYTASLSQHTGIFGLQTKKDIRRSNDILMDIIRTDNLILQQTKVLLSLKDNQLNYRIYQQQSVQSKAQETQDNSLGFMNTINKLRNQNEKLVTELKARDKQRKNIIILVIIICVLMISSILVLYKKSRNIKS